MSTSPAAFEATKAFFGNIVTGLKSIQWLDVPEPVRQFITEHPTLTAIQLVMLLIATCPGLVLTPFFGMIGFSSLGPVAGSYAAWYQSTFGATWAFAGLESAAMVGYATGTVNGIVQGAAAVGGGLAHWFSRR